MSVVNTEIHHCRVEVAIDNIYIRNGLVSVPVGLSLQKRNGLDLTWGYGVNHTWDNKLVQI